MMEEDDKNGKIEKSATQISPQIEEMDLGPNFSLKIKTPQISVFDCRKLRV